MTKKGSKATKHRKTWRKRRLLAQLQRRKHYTMHKRPPCERNEEPIEEEEVDDESE